MCRIWKVTAWIFAPDFVLQRLSGGKEVRLARGGSWEQKVLSGHELRGPAGTGRGSVWWLVGSKMQGGGKGSGAAAYDHRHVCLEFTYLFVFSVTMCSFYILIYKKNILLYFISYYFIFVSKLYLIFIYLTFYHRQTHIGFISIAIREDTYRHTY